MRFAHLRSRNARGERPAPAYRTPKPRSPSGGSSVASTASTRDPRGPSRTNASTIPTASGSPSSTTSTRPSGRFRAHPDTPWARRATATRNPTPWTSPRTTSRRLTTHEILPEAPHPLSRPGGTLAVVEFQELLRRRRMVRHYLSDPLPRETVERVVSVVRRAPSGGFSQGHRLVVVTEPQARAELARLAGEDEYVELGLEPWISTAPVHVFVGAREESYHERYRRPDKLRDGEEIGWPAPYWYVDAGALFMLVQLAALDEGLATGVFGVLPEQVPDVKALLGVPDDVHFVCVLTIGRPAPDPRESDRVSRVSRARLPLEELVRWERW
jgi:FMN reductase [NAD(P)H]